MKVSQFQSISNPKLFTLHFHNLRLQSLFFPLVLKYRLQRVLFHVVATFIEHLKNLKNLKNLKRPSTRRAARPLLPAGGRRLTQGWNPRLTPEEEGDLTCTTRQGGRVRGGFTGQYERKWGV